MIRLTDTHTDQTLTITATTPDHQVRDWLTDTYLPTDWQQHMDEDEWDTLQDAVEQVYEHATATRPDRTPVHYGVLEYLGVRIDYINDLDAVSDAADALTYDQATLRQTCIDALAGGATKIAICEAAGISRPTLDRWIKES